LMLHGLLHLAGYDHETDDGTMARREQTLRARLKLPHGLIERTIGRDVKNLLSGAKASVHSAGPNVRAEARTLQNKAGARVFPQPAKSCPHTKQPGAPSISQPYRGMDGKQRTSAPVHKKGTRP
jgi:hypothetical protein